MNDTCFICVRCESRFKPDELRGQIRFGYDICRNEITVRVYCPKCGNLLEVEEKNERDNG